MRLSTQEEREAEQWARDRMSCLYCNADAGARCVTVSGNPTRYDHMERRDVYFARVAQIRLMHLYVNNRVIETPPAQAPSPS